jgi:hypothetical protein
VSHPGYFPVLKVNQAQAQAMLDGFLETWPGMKDYFEHKTASFKAGRKAGRGFRFSQQFLDACVEATRDAEPTQPIENWRWRFLAQQRQRQILEPFGLVATESMTITQLGDSILIDETHDMR